MLVFSVFLEHLLAFFLHSWGLCEASSEERPGMSKPSFILFEDIVEVQNVDDKQFAKGATGFSPRHERALIALNAS